MQPPLPHPREAERLASLRRLGVLDSPADPRLQRIVALASRLLDTPIALISLLDQHRQWFKARVGLELAETPRDFSFCGHAIIGAGPFVVEDALKDPRFDDNPLVTGDPGIRFYGGVPLQGPEGLPLGTLCVLDRRPRSLDAEALRILVDLADWAARELAHQDLAAAKSLADFRGEILEGVGTSVIVTDLQGVILAFNRTAEQMLGYRAEEVVGRETPALIHVPGEVVARAESLGRELGRPIAPGFEVFVAKARAGGQETRDWTYVRKDGSTFPVTLTVSAIRDGEGELRAFVGVASDCTELHRQQEALRASEQRYQAMAERVPGIIYQFQTWPDGRVAFPFISPHVEELYGVNPETWRANPAWPLEQFLPEDQATYLAAFEDAVARMGTFSWEGRTRTGRPGEVLWIRCQSTPTPQPDGSILWEGLVTDLTPVKSREEALRQNESRSRALLEALPDRVYRIRRDGVILDARVPTGAEIFLPPEEMIGRNIHALLPEETARRIHAGIEAALQEGRMVMVEYGIQVQQRPRDLEARCVPIGGDEVVAVIRDISERKEMERIRDEFVSTVNHELRTPLTAIRGSLGLLMSGVGGDLPDRASHLVGLAHGNSERLARLVNDILDMDKIQAGKAQLHLEATNLATLLEEALDSMVTFDESKGVTFHLEPLPEPVWVAVDRDRFTQVVVNLLSNAAKFSPPGRPVLARVNLHPGWVRIEVEDAGPGIPEAFRPRIFQKFAQADASNTRSVGGTGLGLAIVKSLTEQMGGLVGFRSEPGSTVFYVEFPRMAP